MCMSAVWVEIAPCQATRTKSFCRLESINKRRFPLLRIFIAKTSITSITPIRLFPHLYNPQKKYELGVPLCRKQMLVGPVFVFRYPYWLMLVIYWK